MRVEAITGFCLVSADSVRLAEFYRAIGFTFIEATPIAAAEMELLGLRGGGSRITLSLGPSRLDLERFDRPGQPYPPNTRACDLGFQHLALVADDAEAAWRRALAAGATAISRAGPVTLPDSTGGVTAVKFCDPEGHPLEFLQFPLGARSSWSGAGVMGIDHSAISTSDVAAAQRFYSDLGLSQGNTTINHGPTQEALDGLEGVKVIVAPMYRGKTPPHIECLGYQYPLGRTHLPLAANDIAATRIVWRSFADALIRDPDGHLHQLSR